MKEINNLKGMLVVGYLVEKMQRFHRLHAAGQEYAISLCSVWGTKYKQWF